MPALIAAPASVEALEGMSVKDMRALCTQLAIEYPSRATRLVLTELLAATLFPGDPGPADPPDAASIAGMAKAELQALCGAKGLDADASVPKMREVLVDLLFPIECPPDEAAAVALGHEDVKRVLRRFGLKTTGALVDARRRLVNALFPATPEDELALARLARVSLQRLCVALALSDEGSDEELRGRLKENLGFVPQYDRRTLREKMLGNVTLPIMEALLSKMPEEMAEWLAAAVKTYVSGPAVLTSSDLLEMRAVIKETQHGAKAVPVLACRVPETGLDYLIMVRDLTNALTEARGLPPGVGQVQAESAVMSLLRFARATEAPTEDKSQTNGRDARLEAILEKLVVGARTSSAKFGFAEFAAAASEFKVLGVHLERTWSPNYTALEKMATSVTAKINGVPAPKFPMESTVQPAYLRALVDVRTGNLTAEGGKKLVLDSQDGVVVRTVQEKGGKVRTVAEVVQQFLMYATGVYIVGVGVQLPAGAAIETMIAGRWATPYYLVRFASALHRLVGTQRVTAAALEAILTQLLQQAQTQVNDNEDLPWSADTALAFMTEKVGEQVALAGAMAGVVRARVPEGEAASSKRAKAPQGQGAPRPSGGARSGNQRKCRSCAGFTDHDSGICRRCRDAAGRGAQPKAVGAGARKGAVGVDGK
jgi:hypothetical protein